MTEGKVAILTCDVWGMLFSLWLIDWEIWALNSLSTEHAYYIDYRNNRGAYVAAWWNLVNWEAAEKNLA